MSEAIAEIGAEEARVQAWWATVMTVTATPSLGKFEVRDLLALIFGEASFGDERKLRKWRSLVLFAVASMRVHYEGRRPEDALRRYYARYWPTIAAAQNDAETLAALEDLRDAIRME